MNDTNEFQLKIDVPEVKSTSAKLLKYINGVTYEYELYKLVDQYDPILKQTLEPFDFSKLTVTFARYLAISLLETMKENYGVGLAANQCGLPYRVFVMGAEGVGYAFFNPEIIATDGELKFGEGCLSFPGLYLPITRPESVTIRYWDMNGEEKEQTFNGLSARIVLHEYDHMEGIVFTNKVSPIVLNREKAKVKKNLRVLKAQREGEIKHELIAKAMERLALDAKKKVTADQALKVTD